MNDFDAHWVAQARSGNPQAFRRLVEVHARLVFRVCVRITRDVALAEDAVQETFCKAWNNLPDFGERAAFSSWLHRIAVNAALEQMRRNARHRREITMLSFADEDADADFLAAIPDDQPGPDLQATGAEIRSHIDHHLDSLSALERAAFVLRHFEGESLETIATTLSLNIGQSKQAIFRAVRKLRQALDAWR